MRCWRRQRADLWLPGVIALCGMLLSGAIWLLLVAERHDEILAGGQEVADATRDALEGALAKSGFDVRGAPRDPQDGAAYPPEMERLLHSALRARATGYAVSLRSGEVEIYGRGEPSTDPLQAWWRLERSIEGPGGESWQLVLRPTPAYAAARLSPVPHYLLAAGALLSLVLATLAHQLRLSLRQARFLAAINRALEQRGDELEARVSERTQELEEAVTELEAFNYSVSHDLRTPLGAILNLTSILEEDYREEPLGEEGLALLARIRRSAWRATALLDDLLDLSRAGRTELSLEPIDMTGLAREIFAQVRAAQDDEGVQLVLEPMPTAVADRALLGNVFANLFHNAFKYSRGRDERRIIVRGRREGGECLYEVQDTGHGFDMRFAHKLFGLFERLHSPEEVEGTGIGLAMVERILKRHGGRVWAEGKPGEGARFGFALPVREQP